MIVYIGCWTSAAGSTERTWAVHNAHSIEEAVAFAADALGIPVSQWGVLGVTDMPLDAVTSMAKEAYGLPHGPALHSWIGLFVDT
jgi:hypothetical protein